MDAEKNRTVAAGDEGGDAQDRRGERKPQGWTEAALASVISWFPDLPRPVKVIFASATMYLVLCLMAQVPPAALFEAARGALRLWVQENALAAASQRASVTQERTDMVSLLREQNAALRDDLRALRLAPAGIVPDALDLSRRLEALEARLAAMEARHARREPSR